MQCFLVPLKFWTTTSAHLFAIFQKYALYCKIMQNSSNSMHKSKSTRSFPTHVSRNKKVFRRNKMYYFCIINYIKTKCTSQREIFINYSMLKFVQSIKYNVYKFFLFGNHYRHIKTLFCDTCLDQSMK